MSTVLEFQIAGEPDVESVEDDITLALYAAECVFGKPRVRLESAFLIEDGGRAARLSSSGEAGDVAARILAGLLAARFGEAGYTVRRLDDAVVAS